MRLPLMCQTDSHAIDTEVTHTVYMFYSEFPIIVVTMLTADVL